VDIRLFASVAIAVIFLSRTVLVSAEETQRNGFWGGVDVGAGYVERSVGSLTIDSTDFYMGIKAGYVVHPQVLAGLELSGWNQQATDWDDDTKGAGLMQVFLISRIYPMRDSNLFAKVGGGWVRQWANRPTGKSTLDGWGATVGVGYDYPLGGNWSLTPFFNYGFGKAENQSHQTFTLGVGISFY
jgi:hypothetical protein